LVYLFTTDPKIGCVTGDVKVVNSEVNLLTSLTSMRYWLAFHTERAAQSYANSMMCASGPFSAYPKKVIDRVKESYISQTFLGEKCTYGDDRHLTNLVLSKGYKTKFAPDAVAYTFVPEDLTTFLNQQTRWSKSFYRETLWTIKFWRNIGFYSFFDTIIQPIIFLLFVFSLSLNTLSLFISGNWDIILFYFLSIFLTGFVRSWYAILYTKDWKFLIFSLYGYLHLFVLVPFRFKALLTLFNNSWGTRGKKSNALFSTYLWIPVFWGFVAIFAWFLNFLIDVSDIPMYLLVNRYISFFELLNNIILPVIPFVMGSTVFFVVIHLRDKTKIVTTISFSMVLIFSFFMIFSHYFK
jgi:cellulose synthase/poly-beta-1,6-N-acetylglucosamine synthase-like glycosyltransferase